MLLVHILCVKITLIINTYYEWSSSSLLGVEFRVPLTGEGLGWALCRAGELESIASGPPCDTVTFNTLPPLSGCLKPNSFLMLWDIDFLFGESRLKCPEPLLNNLGLGDLWVDEATGTLATE